MCIDLFAMDTSATTCVFGMFHAFLRVCDICETAQKSAKVNEGISRKNIRKYLDKHPRSPWWITNDRLADFCGISDDDNTHKTTILGKYLPRGQTFWERSAGLA